MPPPTSVSQLRTESATAVNTRHPKPVVLCAVTSFVRTEAVTVSAPAVISKRQTSFRVADGSRDHRRAQLVDDHGDVRHGVELEFLLDRDRARHRPHDRQLARPRRHRHFDYMIAILRSDQLLAVCRHRWSPPSTVVMVSLLGYPDVSRSITQIGQNLFPTNGSNRAPRTYLATFGYQV